MPILRSIFPQKRMEEEIDEELAFHVEQRTRDLAAGGMQPAAAREEALRRFGDVEAVRRTCRMIGLEALRARRREELLDQLKQDTVYSLRTLLRRPGFTALVILILALGIGGTTAIFSVVNGVLLRPLPFEEPDRLVVLWGVESGQRTGSNWASYPDFVDFETASTVFQELAHWSSARMAVYGSDAEPIRVAGARVSYDLFPTLGVQPARGRAFLPEDDRPGAARVAVLSDDFWTSRFGSDPQVVGRTLSIDGVEHTIIGVMAPGFDFPDGRQLWIPAAHAHAGDNRGRHRLMVVGRLKPGVSLQQAELQVQHIAGRLEEEYPETNTNRGARLEKLHETLVGDVRPALLMLFGAVALVLLIVCANVANLLLARSTTRHKEMAIRGALGAGRLRLLQQLLTESLVFAVAGGALGVLLAFVGVDILRSLSPGDIPRLDDVRVDGSVLAFASLISIATGIVFGLLPALYASRPDLQSSLKEGGRTSAEGAGGHPRLRQLLVVGEMALAVVLVVGAALLVNSFLRLQAVDPGYRAANTLVMPISLPESRYDFSDWSKALTFYDRLLERVQALPGVVDASIGYQHPLAGGWETSFSIRGLLEPPQGERPEARIRPVSPGYFRSLGIPLLEGRHFTDRDDEDAPMVVIINESFAHAFFQDMSPIGQRLLKGGWWPFQAGEWEIVGVVADVKMDGLASSTPWAMYFPHRQMPFNDMYVFIGTAGDPLALSAAVRREVWALDAGLPIESIQTMEQIQSSSLAPQRFQMTLLGLFAGIALVLAAVGVYGVLSYAVAQRTGEIGVRMSLGARTSDVLGLVVAQGMKLSLFGLGLGLVGALIATRLIASLLFGVRPGDPATLALVASTLVLVALTACVLPAVRASRVDPVVALRAE